MNNVEYINRIRKFIENDELDSALMALSTLLQNSDKLDEAIHQSGRYENIRKQIRLGIVSHSDANLTQNQIRFGLLDLLREIEKQGEDPFMFSEIERAITILNPKNMVMGSTISANNVHIGDIYNYSGSIDWNGLHCKVFIFHNEAEREWVAVKLIPKLKNIGIEIHLDSRRPTLETFSELGRTVASCKATLLVFPKNPSQYDQMFFNSLAEEGLKNLIPIRLDDHDVPNFFSEHIALSSKENSTEHFRQLFARLDPKNFPIFPELDESLIEISAMPNGGEHIHLFGRQRELQILDAAWANRNYRVLSFTAQGGTGKSALFNRWLADMRRDHFRGAGRVLATSFYSQGTGERVTSADQFINFALHWFGELNFEQRSPWDKGKRLAQLVSEHRTLLVLDGLEPLQEGGAVDTGKVKDPALFTLIRDLAKRNEGLCVITSRLRLGGMERQAAGIWQEDLEQISDEAGKHILRFAGIRGDDAALARVVRQFGNHAFAVNLLGAWLYAHPGHRVDAASSIGDLPEVPLERGQHPRRVIVAFEKLLRENGLDEEVRLLRFLGLFDRPVTEDAMAQLHPFRNLYKSLDRLWMLKLIYREKRHPILRKNKEDMVDCHPLIREHYSEVFAKEEPKVWKKSHAALYKYYKGLPKRLYGKVLPDTLEEMEPLFLAIRHACYSNMENKAFDLYESRISRFNSAFHVKILGGYSEDLSILSYFFKDLWDTPSDNLYGYLMGNNKNAILYFAGQSLLTLGNLKAAIHPLNRSLEISIEEGKANFATPCSYELSTINLTLGNLKEAYQNVEDCIFYSEYYKNGRNLMVQALYLRAYIFLNAGNMPKALKGFEEAEQEKSSMIVIEGDADWIRGLENLFICELLSDIGSVDSALERSLDTLYLIDENSLHHHKFEVGVVYLSIGMAYTRQLKANNPTLDHKNAQKYLDKALEFLRLSRNQAYISFAFIACASFYRTLQNFQHAEIMLEEARDIIEPSNMKLYLTDYHLESARLRIAQDRLQDARPHIAEAAQLIGETRYYRRDKELEELNKLIEA